MRFSDGQTLAVIGAGPKGLAVAVKAKVLEEFGFPVPRVILIEKHGVAAHWSGEFGYTNGEMKLGTSPEKDLVFPLQTDVGDPLLNDRIRRRLMDFSWAAFMIQSGRYSDWIDRGRPAPCHLLWAMYLRWVADELQPQIEILNAEVAQADLTSSGDRWVLSLRASNSTCPIEPPKSLESLESLQVDRLMLTGPGRTRLDFMQDPCRALPSGVYDLESFWSALKTNSFPRTGKLALVGAGENAASVLLALAQLAPGPRVDVIAPKGFVATRAENFYENQFYSQPERNGWSELSIEDRAEFIERTYLGVFSVHAMRILNGEVRHRIVPGRLTGLRFEANGLLSTISYGGQLKTRLYDHVILATGFDQVTTLRSLLSASALEAIEQALGSSLESRSLADAIQKDLSVCGLSPALHLPMLAGLSQGPGFSNLSCLGLLSDRVIASEETVSARTALPPRGDRRGHDLRRVSP